MVLAITQCNKTYPKTDNSIEIRKKQEPDYPGPLFFTFLYLLRTLYAHIPITLCPNRDFSGYDKPRAIDF